MTSGGSVSTVAAESRLVVFVHGAMERGKSFDGVREVMGGSWPTLAYDRRGYGSRRSDGGPYDLSTHAHDLIRIVGSRRATLVGHSLGAHIALLAASLRPATIASVGVYEPSEPFQDWWPRDSAVFAAIAEPCPESAAERFVGARLGQAGWDRLSARTREDRSADGEALYGELSDLLRGRPYDPAAVTCPVVVGFGGRTEPHFRRAAVGLKAVLSESKLVCVEGSGHDCHRTDPLSFAEFVRTAAALGR